ncbi:MAG: phosphodiester glycosidase family protein [Ruminococcaceae bacterium]|nr:phosphodiester glycosidase family protein [Oscillospiraceae bacterium]
MKKTIFVLIMTVLLLLCACKSSDNGENGDANGSSVGNTEFLPNMGDSIVSEADGNGKLPQYSPVSKEDAESALSLVSDSFDEDKTEKLAEGLSLRSISFGDSKAYILTADLSKYSIKASTPYGLAPDGTLQSLGGQKQLSEINGVKAVAAIAANETDRATAVPKGMIVTDGKVLYKTSSNDGSVFFGLYEDGKPFACTYAEYGEIYRNKVTEMVSAAHIIALDGKTVAVAGSVYEEKKLRTGAGFSADGTKLCMVYGENLDISQLSNLLIGSGCSVAVNFGNGGELGMLCGDNLYGANVSVGPALLITEK